MTRFMKKERHPQVHSSFQYPKNLNCVSFEVDYLFDWIIVDQQLFGQRRRVDLLKFSQYDFPQKNLPKYALLLIIGPFI